ncbi:MAG TPA: hypothetical protein VIL86_15380 [Tepidisphaeraceae bacterium]|jgi:hypothetical protein
MHWTFLPGVVALVLSLSTARAAPPGGADEPDVVIPLSVELGDLHDRDCRVFGVPVVCGGIKATFVWGCGGENIITEKFARDCKLDITPNHDFDQYVDPEGKRMFLGEAKTKLEIGGVGETTTVQVMRDSKYTQGQSCTIGYDIAKRFQWELNPLKRTLTLRAAGTHLAAKPLAVLPLKDEAENFWIPIKIRNTPVDVRLIPQTTDIQAGPELQKKWDLEKDGQKVEVNSYMGSIRTILLKGRDTVTLGNQIVERDALVILLDDSPAAKSGIGQSLLNRFVYCVDPKRKEFAILQRIALEQARATTRPATTAATTAPANQ